MMKAYERIVCHTSRLHDAGDIVAMIEVLVLPPSESCRILVSLLSL